MVGMASQVLQNSVAALWSDFCVMLETKDEQKPLLPGRATAEGAEAKTVTSVIKEECILEWTNGSRKEGFEELPVL